MRLIYLGLALLPSLLFAQKHDFTWMMGYGGGGNSDTFGISILNFDPDTTLNISSNTDIRHGFDFANLSMSDKVGNYLFSTNGSRIYNREYQVMAGGEDLNVNEYNGYILPQGVLALPHPKDSTLYALFHGRKGYITKVTKTWYSEIDMKKENGLGRVLRKLPLVQDTLPYGQYTAVQHGNGRDWWVIFQHYCVFEDGCQNNLFYKVLLTPDGVEVFEQKIEDGLATETGAGQAVFTPDGKKYVVSQSHRLEEYTYIDVYDFDRCTGKFSNRKQIQGPLTTEENGGSGLVVSPDSRFAYLIMYRQIIQYDLTKQDALAMEASRSIVAKYDGFVQYIGNNFPLATRFLFGQLAPDGKIYISTTNATRYLHVIHNPNVRGLNCNVEQHGIELPTFNGFSIPNHPNYRLGAWEGSPCDTLKDIVSTTAVSKKSSVKLYPNPAFDVLNIELETTIPYKKIEVQVYDLLGKQLGTFHDTYSLPLDYSAGLYLVQVWIDQKLVKTEKLIIQQ